MGLEALHLINDDDDGKYMDIFPLCIPIYIEQRYICARKNIKSLYAQVNVPGTGTFGSISAKFVLST